MDTYFPKTRRINGNLSLKRPAQSITPPKPSKLLATPTTPKDARIHRPKDPPPILRKRQRVVKQTNEPSQEIRDASEQLKTVHRQLFESSPPHKSSKTNAIPDVQPLDTSTAILSTPKKAISRLTRARPSPAPELPQSPRKEQPNSPSKITKGPLKGVSSSLLDLIRAKEAASRLITPEDERRRVLLGIAPDVARIVATIFTVNNKDIMPYDKIVEKCFRALKSNYETKTIDECLELMDKITPEWISTVQISRGRFMRINKDKYSIPQLLEAIKKYKSSNE